MIKTNNIFVRLLVCLLIVLTLANFIGSINIDTNYSFATEEEPDSGEERADGLLGSIISGITGAIINFLKWVVLAPFRAARSVNYALASAGGTTEDVGKNEITPFDIFFNKFTLLDANIFSTTNEDGDPLPQDGVVYKIRVNTSIWYYAIRALAISIAAIMLLWNLVRAISKNTSPEQKVIAKNSLTDWVLSFALIMFMHIIVIIVLSFNDEILKAIEGFTPLSDSSDFLDALENAVFAQNITLGVASLIVYALLNWQTFKYILIYIQRLLIIVLLIMISPIVPITYSTDRMRGGRGAALNGWFKELIFNVFVQTVHAIVYAALVGVAMSALTATSVNSISDLGPAIIAVVSMLFIKYAERMVKTIFGFEGSQLINNNVITNTANSIKNYASERIRNGSPNRSAVSFGTNIDGNTGGVTQAVKGFGEKVGEKVSNVAGAVKGGATRVANGDKLLTFGKDSNGNDIGVGQVVAGIGSSLGRSVRNTPKTVKATGLAFRDGLLGRDNQTPKEEESLRELQDAVKQVNEKEKEEKSKEEKNQEENTQTVIEREREVPEGERGEDKEKDKNKVDNIQTVEEKNEETKVEESDIEETDIERPNDNILEGDEPITVGLDEGVNDDLLDDFKKDFRAILNDDRETLEKWAQEVQNKINSLEDKVDEDVQNGIVDTIQAYWNDDDKVVDFVNGFEKGTPEREYAEAIADLRASMMNIDDESNFSKEEQLQSLIASYNAKGLEIPKEFSQVKDEKQLDRLTISGRNVNFEDAGTNNSENRNNLGVTFAENSPKVETISGAIQNSLGRLGVKINGTSEGEIQTEIEEDFNARIEEVAAELGRQPNGIDDILKNMDKQSQEQFRNYKRRKVSPDKLNDKAKNLAILEREARYLKFEMKEGKVTSVDEQVGEVNMNSTTIETSYSDGDRRTIVGETFSKATEGTIVDLRQKKAELESKKKSNKKLA